MLILVPDRVITVTVDPIQTVIAASLYNAVGAHTMADYRLCASS